MEVLLNALRAKRLWLLPLKLTFKGTPKPPPELCFFEPSSKVTFRSASLRHFRRLCTSRSYLTEVLLNALRAKCLWLLPLKLTPKGTVNDTEPTQRGQGLFTEGRSRRL